MHCEGPKTYDHSGTCPVCHMKLEKETNSTAPLDQFVGSVKYRVDTTLTNALPPNREVEIRLYPRVLASGRVLTDFSAADKTPLKADLVAQDLSLLESETVKSLSGGAFQINHRFEKGGNYILYVRFTPKGDFEQVFPVAVQVTPAAEPVFDLRRDRTLKRKIGNISFRLAFSSPPRAGTPTQLNYEIRGLKRPSEEGAKFRIIAVSEDTTWYFETQETVRSDKNVLRVSSSISFPKPGFYRAWIEPEVATPGIGYTILVK